MTDKEYLNRVYAGFLGMNIGIRLGAPVEPSQWTSERIERFYGDIHSYIKDFKHFAADDDVNGPVYFLRALQDGDLRGNLQASDVAEAWLNYAREGVGMFWWGGYGVSTEHTAYLHLKSGIPAPESGSIALQGKTLAEQIGGQIFIDTWALLFPGDCETAALYARTAASVSHDGEGLEGAAFIAASIAKAFVTEDIDEILDAALHCLSGDSTYTKVVKAVRAYHADHPDSWRSCLRYLQEFWGYDRYPGVCHIIPNAGVCVMAMLYGRTFGRAVEIATMAGWDTDCNAGNVGSILGVAGGLEQISEAYRRPVNDMVVLSGISGYLNILDIPTYAKQVCALGYRLKNQTVPQECMVEDGVIDFDFSLPGSTHGFGVSNSNACTLSNTNGELEMLYDRMVRPQSCRLFYKPFYRRADFDDERYMPVFSPTIYPGQTVHITYRLEKFSGESVLISGYVRNTFTGELVVFSSQVVYDQDTHVVEFTIDPDHPALKGAMIDEVGLCFEANSPAKNRDFGVLHLSRFFVTGKSRYFIDAALLKKEFASIIPFSHNHGSWDLVHAADNRVWMEVMTLDFAQAMTGSYYTRDVQVGTSVVLHGGTSALLALRIQGTRRGYYGGFHQGQFGIFKQEKGLLYPLSCIDVVCELDREYTLRFRAEGTHLVLASDDFAPVAVDDAAFSSGMIGCGLFTRGRVGFSNFDVHEV
ncbi:MAG: ADP-ribosylglycohydrolase family protein [Sphaerochaeta sp.]|uniref:ADP-ribosylglycohydrolase family protein n=1 Tax=Sphaerochaeta sp. TaxID=1972642 RepID=UPI003D0D3E60